jgi:hypothetical protein
VSIDVTAIGRLIPFGRTSDGRGGMAKAKPASTPEPDSDPLAHFQQWADRLRLVVIVLRDIGLVGVGLWGIVLQVQRDHADPVALTALVAMVGAPLVLHHDDWRGATGFPLGRKSDKDRPPGEDGKP